MNTAPTAVPTDTVNCHLNHESITVGEKVSLECKAEAFTISPSSIIQFVDINSSGGYEIAFLGPPQVSQNIITQAVTSYKVGDHELNLVKLKVGEQEFLVSKLVLKVTSVLPAPPALAPQPPEAGKGSGTTEPSPFPVFDPIQVGAPWWWWAIWGTLILAVVSFVAIKFIQWRKAKKIADAAAIETKPLSSPEKFRQRMRKLESHGYHLRGEYKRFALELTSILKTAIAEQLKFSVEDMTSEEVISTLEKRHKNFYQRAGASVSAILGDLDQIKFAKIETDTNNCLSLLDRTMKVGHILFEGQL